MGIQGYPQNSGESYPTQEEIDSFLRRLTTDNTRSDVFLRALNFPEIQTRHHIPSTDPTVKPRFSNQNKWIHSGKSTKVY